jgi:hypothetical protein
MSYKFTPLVVISRVRNNFLHRETDILWSVFCVPAIAPMAAVNYDEPVAAFQPFSTSRLVSDGQGGWPAPTRFRMIQVSACGSLPNMVMALCRSAIRKAGH